MLTQAQETAYIHGLLPRLLDPDSSILIVEDLVSAGYSYKESNPVIERLETENLAKRSYATTVILTTLGRQVARDPRGYQAYLRRQRCQAFTKTVNEWLGAYGSLAGGVAGIAGVILSISSLLGSSKTASEMDGVRTQLRALTQAQATTNTRLTLLEQQSIAASQKPTNPSNPAVAPSSAKTTKPAPSISPTMR